MYIKHGWMYILRLNQNHFFHLKNLNNNTQHFEGGKIADNIASLIAGNTSVIDFSNKIEVTEFDNVTEFAGYIAKI